MYTKATVLALAALTVAAPVVEDRSVKIPIRGSKYVPKTDGSADLSKFLRHASDTLVKYGANPLPDTALIGKRASTANEPLTDQVETGGLDELYYGSGTVGATNPQTFTFDFDTGSSDTFIPGPKCGTAQGCTGTTKYSQGGTDEHNTTSITYGSGMVEGENYYDTVCVAGLCGKHQNVISLTDASGFSSSASNSLMGMAFQSIAESKQPPFFKTLIDQGVVSQPEFAFYLGRSKSGTASKSEMTLGGVDSSRYSGAMTLVPVSSQTYWQVPLDAVTVNGKSAGATTKGQAAIDTGTTLIVAPTAAAAAIFALIPGAVPLPLVSGSPTETFYAYPCNSNAKVAITFAGKSFAINPLDFNFGTLQDDLGLPVGAGYCLAGILAADLDPTENLYVVGDTFIKNWYSTFSYTSAGGKPGVSFAKAVGNQ